jgi:hypothetical protein
MPKSKPALNGTGRLDKLLSDDWNMSTLGAANADKAYENLTGRRG